MANLATIHISGISALLIMQDSSVDTNTVKLTFRTTNSLLREMKHLAADSNLNLTEILNQALLQYIKSRKVTTFEGDKLRNDVSSLYILVMKKLKQIAEDDETVPMNIHYLYEEACKSAGSPGGIGAYDSTNQRLKNRVIQELFGKAFINQANKDEVTLTYRGKSRPEFT